MRRVFAKKHKFLLCTELLLMQGRLTLQKGYTGISAYLRDYLVFSIHPEHSRSGCDFAVRRQWVTEKLIYLKKKMYSEKCAEIMP